MERENSIKKSLTVSLIIALGILVSIVAIYQQPLFTAVKMLISQC